MAGWGRLLGFPGRESFGGGGKGVLPLPCFGLTPLGITALLPTIISLWERSDDLVSSLAPLPGGG